METPAPMPPPRRGFFRRLFSWRTARKVLFVLAALITLGALFIAEEDWRGSRAWANYKRDMEAKGERFDMGRLIPPKVPDDQNFAMTPLMALMFDLPQEVLRQPLKLVTNIVHGEAVVEEVHAKRGRDLNLHLTDSVVLPHRFTWQYGLAADLIVSAKGFKGTNSATPPVEIKDPVQAASVVLDNLKPFESTLAELQSASARPFCRFNIPYEEWDNPQVLSAYAEHFNIPKQLDRVLTLHAESEMVLGRTDLALKDITVMFRLDDGLKDEPLLISQLVRIACAQVILQSVGEGLAEHRWSEEQLKILQDRLGKTDLIASTVLSFYGERDICWNPAFDRGYTRPQGWNRLEQLNLNRAFIQTVVPRIDLAARVVNPSVNHAMNLALPEPIEGMSNSFSALLHHNIMARMSLPIYSHVGEKAALAQSGVDMATVACALERYRLALGQYPETLNVLVPRFAAVLPHDIINGQPLKYRRTDSGNFILYSVGWNEKDDGGEVVKMNGNPDRQDILQGDWVWQYPETP